MNSVEIPSIHDEFMDAFRAFDFDRIDILHGRVETVYKSLFERLTSGDIDGFYYKSEPRINGYNMYLYTRSVKTDGIQRSVIWNRDGEDIPLSDSQYKDFEDLKRDGCSDGVVMYWFRLGDFYKNNTEKVLTNRY